MTGFTQGLTFFVDMTVTGSSIVVSTGPFYPGTGRTAGDVDQAGSTPSAGLALAAVLNENTANDADFITGLRLTDTFVGPTMVLSSPYVAGTYMNLKIRKWTINVSSGIFKVRFLNDSGTLMGETAEQTMTATPTTYTLPFTLIGTATRIQIQERT
jgi:hypothetical protein